MQFFRMIYSAILACFLVFYFSSGCAPGGITSTHSDGDSHQSNTDGNTETDSDANPEPDANADGEVNPSDSVGDEDTQSNDAGLDDCEPPDMLIVLDRTMSMAKRPDGVYPPNTQAGHRASKWYLAVTSLEEVSVAFEETIRFGLELFPRDPGQDTCVTLRERINGVKATNPKCKGGEVLVTPNLSTGNDIGAILEPETTTLCTSTPIGPALSTAATKLANISNPIRDQYVLLLTDGRDTCDKAVSLANAQQLAAAGIKLYVIGFNGSTSGISMPHLNDLACAGRTAIGFPTHCTQDGQGNFAATQPNGQSLFIVVENGHSLTSALEDIAGHICCNCPT